MSLASETSKIAAFFKKGSSMGFHKNEFTNTELKLSDYPAIAAAMDEALPDGVVPEDRASGYSVSLKPGMFDVQWHQTSVGEHTDDVLPGGLFQLLVLRTITEVETAYDTMAQFTGYNASGRKETTRLIRAGDSVVFAPAKKHSLIYFGDAVILALRSVRKGKNAGVSSGSVFSC